MLANSTARPSLLAIALTILALSSCTDEDASRRALEAQGFENIEFHGYAFWECGGGEAMRRFR